MAVNKSNIVEIKKGEEGTGLLIEHDGYISVDCGDNRNLFEAINTKTNGNGEFYCPKPFIVSAVFQKYGIENANGRIYPEGVLKREVDKYQLKIKERRAVGECYRPEAMILTETGWKHLYEVSEGEDILTLNPETNAIEYNPIKKIVHYHYDGPMINIRSRFIDDVVTPDHGYPIYNKDHTFVKFVTAKEIMESNSLSKFYIPKDNDDITKGIYLNKPFLTAKEVDYNGDVMCVEVDNHIWYVMDNGKCHWTKNCNHPNESVIDLSRVAINIIELHWEGRTLVGKMEILISEGFHKYGIISCQGDMVAHLLLNGIKIGVSSRGLGTVTNKMGVLYVADDYEIVCWDVVSDPSTPNAWITPEDKIPEQYMESTEKKSGKDNVLLEKIRDNFKDWLIL